MHQKTKSGLPTKWLEPWIGKPDTTRGESDSSMHQRKPGQLDRQAKLLLFVNVLFVTAGALSATFVNVYLWKVKSEFAPIAWFTFTTYLSSAITFWLAGAWVKRYNKMNSLRLGMGISAMFYLLVLLLGPKTISYVILLGFIQGMASGFFWLSFNVVYFEITERDNRDKFNGWAGLLASGTGMIAPWISGMLISKMADQTGYRLIFALSLALYVIGVIVSFFLKKRQSPGDYSWLFAFQCIRQNREWRWAASALAAQGLREGLFGVIIGLFVYISTKSEMTVGNYWLITSAVGLVSYYLAGKLLKPRYRKPGMLSGAVLMTGVVLVFFWQVSYTTLLIFGIFVSIAYPLFSIPIISTVFDLIGTNEESARNRVEYVILREFALDAGRLTGMLLFLAVTTISTAPSTLNWLIFFVGFGPILAWFCMSKLFGRVPHADPAREK